MLRRGELGGEPGGVVLASRRGSRASQSDSKLVLDGGAVEVGAVTSKAEGSEQEAIAGFNVIGISGDLRLRQ